MDHWAAALSPISISNRTLKYPQLYRGEESSDCRFPYVLTRRCHLDEIVSNIERSGWLEHSGGGGGHLMKCHWLHCTSDTLYNTHTTPEPCCQSLNQQSIIPHFFFFSPFPVYHHKINREPWDLHEGSVTSRSPCKCASWVLQKIKTNYVTTSRRQWMPNPLFCQLTTFQGCQIHPLIS